MRARQSKARRGVPLADEQHALMRRVVALARRGRGRTSPNPLVGALVVKKGRVVGQGYHRRAGSPHAEVLALRDAGTHARGADLYVNLEPCCHHGRTAPCTDAILSAGVARVFVGIVDPNPLVNGAGIRQLRRAGIPVEAGVLQDECAELNEAFIRYIRSGRPFVCWKSAMTLDGRVATRAGHSRWVTSAAARRLGHRMRSEHDAIVVGVGTVLADDPRLDCRDVRGGRDPIRVVIDSSLRVPLGAAVVKLAGDSSAPTWIVTTRRAPAARAKRLERAGVEVIRVASERGQVKISSALEELARRDVLSLLLEGGPTLAGGFWRARLVDRIACFIAPKILGDAAAQPLVRGPTVARMTDAVPLESVSVRRIAGDVLIGGRVDSALGRGHTRQ
jgi:diaminohydroxyphosphoribosylaminopyrimidine deaminase/5-amino-6-(5-phosphoribosylamino)uracil reductase